MLKGCLGTKNWSQACEDSLEAFKSIKIISKIVSSNFKMEQKLGLIRSLGIKNPHHHEKMLEVVLKSMIKNHILAWHLKSQHSNLGLTSIWPNLEFRVQNHQFFIAQ